VQCFYLTSVCLMSVAYTRPRTERSRQTRNGTEVAHVARDSDTIFKVKGSNSQHAGIGATWRINTKIWSTCRGRRHIVEAGRLEVV